MKKCGISLDVLLFSVAKTTASNVAPGQTEASPLELSNHTLLLSFLDSALPWVPEVIDTTRISDEPDNKACGRCSQEAKRV